MKCPVCADRELRAVTLEDDLPGHRCEECAGLWLPSSDYLGWLSRRGALLPEKPAADTDLPTLETQRLKLCPECGRMLMRYRVLPNVEFFLDHCGGCNGVWLDKDEWEVLVARNLHDKVNRFFTDVWQVRRKHEETRAVMERLYRERFGETEYDRAREVRAWLREHPARAMLLAYLQAEDPYQE